MKILKITFRPLPLNCDFSFSMGLSLIVFYSRKLVQSLGVLQVALIPLITSLRFNMSYSEFHFNHLNVHLEGERGLLILIGLEWIRLV